jgi:biotin carboxyl carrier protein
VSVDGGDALLDASGVSADQLSEVLALIAATEITELDVNIGATRLSLRRSPAAAPALASPASEPRSQEPTTLAIASPLVGIFRPSVSAGASLEPGQSIGAIEALGMPTSVEAPQSGTVEELLVEDGAPVEFGQPLLILRRAPASTR